MKYKFYVFVPDDEDLINLVIEAASGAGAGIMGKYTQCAFTQKGQGRWKSDLNAKPFIGKPGEVTRANEVKIEMECPKEKAKLVKEAITKVHPYEEVVIDFVKLEDI